MHEIKRYIEDHELNTQSRKRDLVYKRFYLINYVRLKNPSLNLTQIAQMFGGHEHTKALYGIKMYDILKNDKVFVEITHDVAIHFPLHSAKRIDTNNESIMFRYLNNLNQQIQSRL